MKARRTIPSFGYALAAVLVGCAAALPPCRLCEPERPLGELAVVRTPDIVVDHVCAGEEGACLSRMTRMEEGAGSSWVEHPKTCRPCVRKHEWNKWQPECSLYSIALEPVPVTVYFGWQVSGWSFMRPVRFASGDLTFAPEQGQAYALKKEHHTDWGVPMGGHWSCRIENERTGEVVAAKEFCSCYVGAYIPVTCPREPSAAPKASAPGRARPSPVPIRDAATRSCSRLDT